MTALAMDEPEDDNVDVALPDVGVESAPSSEDIVQGRVGNGTYDRFTPELASRMNAERAEMKREVIRARREAYEEGMKDALAESANLTTGLVKLGNDILKRLENGESVKLSQRELDTLKLANTANKDIPDRAIGKPKARSESDNQTTVLNVLMGRVEHIDDQSR